MTKKGYQASAEQSVLVSGIADDTKYKILSELSFKCFSAINKHFCLCLHPKCKQTYDNIKKKKKE